MCLFLKENSYKFFFTIDLLLIIFLIALKIDFLIIEKFQISESN